MCHLRPAQRNSTVSRIRRFETCGKLKMACTETSRLASNASEETEFSIYCTFQIFVFGFWIPLNFVAPALYSLAALLARQLNVSIHNILNLSHVSNLRFLNTFEFRCAGLISPHHTSHPPPWDPFLPYAMGCSGNSNPIIHCFGCGIWVWVRGVMLYYWEGFGLVLRLYSLR